MGEKKNLSGFLHAQGIYSPSHFLIWHFVSSSTKSSKCSLNGKKKSINECQKTVSQLASQTTNIQKCDFILNNIMNWRISNRNIKRRRKCILYICQKDFQLQIIQKYRWREIANQQWKSKPSVDKIETVSVVNER